ncbi:MAG: hypothetical protein QGI45_07330 [Myxococcota bacterium]|jgi:hypothetical protein|nr:hypothetical protein [Myxococcota bacterium]
MTQQSQTANIIEKLWPRLLKLKRMRQKIIIQNAAGIIIFLLVLSKILPDDLWQSFPQYWEKGSIQFYFIVALGLGFGLGYLQYYTYMRDFCSFVNDIVREMWAIIHPDLQYLPEEYVPQELFVDSNLFSESIARYEGKDLVVGKLTPGDAQKALGSTDTTEIKLSIIHAKKSAGFSSEGSEHFTTIFYGLFFVAEFKKRLRGDISLNRSVPWYQALFQNEVEFRDPEFEKKLIVSPLMKKIVELTQKNGRKSRISFNNQRVYVGISPGGIQTSTCLLHDGVLEQYLADIELLFALVADLNSNRHIWC